MTPPIEQQLRDYFADVDASQGRVDVTAITAIDPVVAHPMVEPIRARRSRPTSRRRTLVLVAAAAVLVVCVGLLLDLGGERGAVEVEPADPEPSPSVPTTLPLGREEIRVSADSVEFGDGLVGSIENMARTDGRTYVVAERIPTEAAVLAAFDDGGRELWRTELGGGAHGIEALHGDLWVGRGEGVTRIDASDGRVLGEVATGSVHDLDAAFDALWVVTRHPSGSGFQLIRVDPDLSTETVELPLSDDPANHEPWTADVAAGAGALWVPMWADGLAMIDPGTLALTMIPAGEIGHLVDHLVAVDGDVAYVASGHLVTPIVDGRAQTTADTYAEIQYLGPLDGAFGVQLRGGQFVVLQANDPMVVERRQISTDAIVGEVDGEAWVETGLNRNLRRVELLPLPAGDG